MSRLLLLTVCLSVSLTTAAQDTNSCVPVPTGYTVQDLGTLGGQEAGALAINSSGQVTGWSRISSGLIHPFLWSSTGGMQDLGDVCGSGFAVGTALNDAGEVVGYCYKNSLAYAFRWTSSGGVEILPTLGGTGEGTYAWGINNQEQIVGSSTYPGAIGPGHAVLWDATGLHDLGTLPGATYSEALAINNKSQIVGDTTAIGFIWTPQKGMQKIDAQSQYFFSAALAINNIGYAAGYGTTSIEGRERAVLWPSGLFLGLLSGNFSEAYALNDNCQVVGAAQDSGPFKGFIWTPTTGLIDLNTLTNSTEIIASARGINASGQIVGGTVFFGKFGRALLLNPIP